MSGFHFSLSALLRLRRNLVRREEIQLARLLAVRTQLANDLQEVRHRARACMEASNAAMARGTTGAELASNAIASSNYRLWATRIQADIHRLMPAIELQRAHYREAQQEQEKVEMLRDQAYRTWKQERSRREQQATDQLFLLRRRKPAMQP